MWRFTRHAVLAGGVAAQVHDPFLQRRVIRSFAQFSFVAIVFFIKQFQKLSAVILSIRHLQVFQQPNLNVYVAQFSGPFSEFVE